MFPARLSLRYLLVGVATCFFLAGVFFHASAATDQFLFTSPLPESTVSGPDITLHFSLPASFRLTDYTTRTKPVPDQGHIHLWIDQPPQPSTAIEVTSATYTLKNVKYGTHTIYADLVGHDHQIIEPRDLISLTVTNLPATSTPDARSLLHLSLLSVALVISALALVSYHRRQLATPRPSSRQTTSSPRRRSRRSKK